MNQIVTNSFHLSILVPGGNIQTVWRPRDLVRIIITHGLNYRHTWFELLSNMVRIIVTHGLDGEGSGERWQKTSLLSLSLRPVSGCNITQLFCCWCEVPCLTKRCHVWWLRGAMSDEQEVPCQEQEEVKVSSPCWGSWLCLACRWQQAPRCLCSDYYY